MLNKTESELETAGGIARVLLGAYRSGIAEVEALSPEGTGCLFVLHEATPMYDASGTRTDGGDWWFVADKARNPSSEWQAACETACDLAFDEMRAGMV